MTIDKTRFRAVFHHPQRDPKTRIVLHFTAGGSAGGAVAWWNSQYQQRGRKFYVGTPFVVDRDPVPTVYEIFPREAWAYGLGISNAAVERSSVQIEVVNYGFLRKTPGGFVAAPNPAVRIPDHEVVQARYRGQDYWQAFPQAQVLAVAQLCRELCDQFGIPRLVPPKERRGVCDQAWAIGYQGIVDHTNFVKAGKWDMGPAWPWDLFQELLNK